MGRRRGRRGVYKNAKCGKRRGGREECVWSEREICGTEGRKGGRREERGIRSRSKEGR